MAHPIKREKITATIRRWFAEARYRPGDRFPSDQELARQFAVTHVTVRAALRPLVEEGLLERRIGWGTLVRDARAAETPSTALASAVGVAVPDATHSFFNEALRAIEGALLERGRPLVLGHTWESADREETVLRSWAAEGLRSMILVPSGGCSALYERLLTSGVRLVFIDREDPAVDVAAITSRDEQAAFELTTRLRARGGKVVHLAGAPGASTGRARRAGFLRALADAPEASFDVVPAGFFIDDGYRAMKQVLNAGPSPRAVLAANDPVAVGALRALAECGLEVPGDVRVAGFGDTELGRSFDLTSVRQFPEQMGAWAVELLLGRGGTGRACSRTLEPQIVERGSTL